MRFGNVNYILLKALSKIKNDKYLASVINHWLNDEDTRFMLYYRKT